MLLRQKTNQSHFNQMANIVKGYVLYNKKRNIELFKANSER
ncbi:hypothetical protein PAUR_a2433 [Pseudoalteromonas aurantia 208]|uniref:Orphan protein n=1 Tax=Pseudoalteromonas aurantia 208 TaxID=1314867 RepID=A0ABR9EEQ6_9GAMM|nr:hypothetical protein [Pseudoalteromonas aurantia 208]